MDDETPMGLLTGQPASDSDDRPSTIDAARTDGASML
jgi:hypothetical protein